MTVQMTDEGLLIDGQPCPLYAGAVQYWRLDPDRWESVLDAIVALGLGMIEVYLPWSYHERAPGIFDFTGELDAGSFLDLAHARGLRVIARPGPHTNAELTGFGYPDWVLKDPDCQARAADGNPVFVPTPPRMFPMPTYAGDRLYAHCRAYLERVAGVLAPRQHPDGPVVMVQPDNEMSFFFRTAAFDLDYAPAARADYQAFLKKRYRTIERLNRAHGTDLLDFDELRPPERFAAKGYADLAPYLDWTAYREHYLKNGVARVAAMLRGFGIDRVPMSHNIPLGSLRSPFDLPGLEEEVDLAGVDMYYRRGDHRDMRARCLELSGASRFPFAPEFASGGYHAWPPGDLLDQEFTTLWALMHGVRGFNFYMIVDRERWFGAPIRRDGTRDPRRFDFYRRILDLADRLGDARRQVDCVLLSPRRYGQLISLHNVLDPLSPMALAGLGLRAPDWCEARDLGRGLPEAATLAALHESLFDGLSAARVAFEVGEVDRPADNLSRYCLAVLPAVGVLDRPDAQRLLAFVQAGGTLLLGPEVPAQDFRGQGMHLLDKVCQGRGRPVPGTTARAHRRGEGQIVVARRLLDPDRQPTQFVQQLGAIALAAGCLPTPDAGDPRLASSAHFAAERGWLWLANPTAEERQAVIQLSEAAVLWDHFRQEGFSGDGLFEVPMPPWCVRPLEVRP